MITITLPDGSTKQFDAPISGLELATSIGAGLAKAAVGFTTNGTQRDLDEMITTDCTATILTPKDKDGLDIMRHTTTAQALARAIKELYPGAKLAIGPTIEHGFYYDIAFAEPLSADDLPKVEEKMRQILKQNLRIVREEWAAEDVKAHFASKDESYKVMLVEDAIAKGDLIDGSKLSVFRQMDGDTEVFFDLCRGPHVKHMGQISTAFTLTNLAGAYWRGDSKNEQLTRIYGVQFNTKQELEDHLTMLEEAKKRDHRKLGKELDIFEIRSEEIGNGLPLWLPNGSVLRQELEMLATEEERKDGYHRVSTPVLAKEALYEQSGHLPYYAEDMYAAIEIDDERYRLKPMNCPHHHHCYAARPKSYRDLPYRIAEYGTVHRYEAHGGLSGLMRVRGMCMNDAHIYCTEAQVKDEFIKVMHMHQRYYNLFGITDDNFYMRLSKPDMAKLDKYVDQPEAWEKSLDLMVEAMQGSGLKYEEAHGEAAFYGPKVDFQIKNAIGVEYTISTNQLDFLATQRFNLTYTAEDGTDKPLYVIHRAPLGTHERFIAFLLEHYEGRFPTWLAPVQAMVIPITDEVNDYAHQVRQQLFDADVRTATGGLRVEVDTTSERMQKKILVAQQKKIPYMLVVGKKEAEAGTVAVRLRSGEDLGAWPIAEVIARMTQEIATRTDLPAKP